MSCRFSLLLTLAFVVRGFAAEVDFTEDVYPILTQHCTKCHGEKKQAGELALHLPSAIEDFGVVSAGDPEGSSLYDRIILPADDDLSMPKGGNPLGAADVEIIRAWIEAGAELPADDGFIETIEEQFNLPEVEPADEAAIATVEQAGGKVIQLYEGSPLLQVSFAHGASPATDGSLAALAGVAPQVVSLNLARAEITDEGLAALVPLANLMRLHLENTKLTDAGLAHLAGLQRLEYLNLYGTDVSDAGLTHLAGLANLQKLFLWQTQVSYDAAMALADSIEGLDVNLGWDHPEVKKAREARLAELAAMRKEAAAAEEGTPDEPPANDEAANDEAANDEAGKEEATRDSAKAPAADGQAEDEEG